MKHLLPPGIIAAAALFASAVSVHAEVSPFRLRVEQSTKSDTVKNTKNQTRALKIYVSNTAKDPAELLAKYVFFGRDVNKGDIVKIDEGEKAVSAPALGTGIAETGSVSTSFEEAHMPGSGSKGGKRIEASGNKFVGYGVQVFQGEKLVAEYYDPASGKEQWTKAYPAKLPTAPKKK